MTSIFKRELRSYFTTPIGYIFVAVLLALSGLCFSFVTMLSQSSDTSEYFTLMLFLYSILIPILTMKLFAEERKLKTEQLLLTSPISCPGMVLGKFFAAFLLFAATLVFSCICNFTVLVSVSDAKLNFPEIVGNLFGIILVGAAFIALGILISSFTENQLIAAIVTIGVIILLLFVSALPNILPTEGMRVLVRWLSVMDRFTPFGFGIFSLPSIIFYLSLTVIFLFLTTRVFETRRW